MAKSMATRSLRGWALGIFCGVLLATSAAALWLRPRAVAPVTPPTPGASTTVSGLPVPGPPVRLTPPEVIGVPAVMMQVPSPDKLLQLAGANGWLQQVVKTPLGRGFLGGWAALLGSMGEDLRASFHGPVARFLAERLLDKPTALIWFTGARAPSTPALVVMSPTEASKVAFAVMTRASQRGTFVSACPSPPAVTGRLPDRVVAHPTLTISRWLIAERPIYAALEGPRLVLAANPDTVLHALCAVLPEMTAAADAAVDIAFFAHHMGREAQLLATLLGVGDTAHVVFDFGPQNTLVPHGIAAAMTVPGHLDTQPLAADLLKTIPEDVPVVLGVQLRLPQEINAQNLKAHFAGAASTPPLATRQAALVWYPRAGLTAPIDVALVWSRPADRAALQEAFSGNNALFWREGCGQLVLASNAAMGDRLARACAGKDPSVLHGAAAVTAGLARPTSIALGVNVGRLLANLLREGYAQDPLPPPQEPSPPEIEAAARQLLELPFVGLHGVLGGSALAPEGFHT